MWKLTIMLFIFLTQPLYAGKVSTKKFSDEQKTIILNSCMELQKGQKNKKDICQCVIRNLDQTLESKKQQDFIVKYYKKKTKMECGDFTMLCSGDFNIAASCSEDIKYDMHDPHAKHSHGD